MRIGVPRETAEGERRVALVPEVVQKLADPPGEQGAPAPEVLVQRGAGAEALIPDQQYEEAGATLRDAAEEVWGSDVVVKVAVPSEEEVSRLRPETILIGFLAPLTAGERIQAI